MERGGTTNEAVFIDVCNPYSVVLLSVGSSQLETFDRVYIFLSALCVCLSRLSRFHVFAVRSGHDRISILIYLGLMGSLVDPRRAKTTSPPLPFARSLARPD